MFLLGCAGSLGKGRECDTKKMIALAKCCSRDVCMYVSRDGVRRWGTELEGSP